MKFINKTLLLSAGAALGFFAACDDIDKENRLIPVERAVSEKTVLMTEFTGQRCPNCPDGAEIIHSLSEANSGKFVAVAMHPSESGFCEPIGPVKLTSPIADEYFRYYGRPANFPTASIDFGSLNESKDGWSADVMTVLNSAVPPATLHALPSYDDSSRTLTARCEVSFTENVDAETSLLLLITEDGIVGPQQSRQGLIRDYVFNHILRASMNGTWGESIGSGFQAGESVTVEANLKLADNWNPENCNVVAVLLDTRTRRALQAAEISVSL